MSVIIPEAAIRYIYTAVFRPRLLKKAVNFFVSALIKEKIKIREGFVALNKKDPVVSGALTLGFYEKIESEFIKTKIRPGMVAIDIGANVGFYTVIFSSLVGPQGRVISFEPEPENFYFLEKTIEINDFKNVTTSMAAVSDKSGTGKLFLCRNNKGDHRIYNPNDSGRDGVVDVSVTTLDDFLDGLNLAVVDLIKMDIQGAEGLALKGMKNTLIKNKNIMLLFEFWPLGLSKSGTDSFSLLNELEALGFKIFRIRENSVGADLVSDYALLVNECSGDKYANLFCVRL